MNAKEFVASRLTGRLSEEVVPAAIFKKDDEVSRRKRIEE